MYERFTDGARKVVVLAQEEARERIHSEIDEEHLLLGLLGVEDGIAAQALGSFGVTLEAAREQVKKIHGGGTHVTPGHIPFSPRAKTVLERSLREALQLGHNYIGTEHILLALIRTPENQTLSIAIEVLDNLQPDFDMDLTALRAEVTDRLTVRKDKQPEKPKPVDVDTYKGPEPVLAESAQVFFYNGGKRRMFINGAEFPFFTSGDIQVLDAAKAEGTPKGWTVLMVPIAVDGPVEIKYLKEDLRKQRVQGNIVALLRQAGQLPAE